MVIAALQSTEYLQCQDKDFAIVWSNIKTNATIPARKCANDTNQATLDDLYYEMVQAMVPADFLKMFEASSNCENFYRFYQSALRTLDPPCLDGNTSTIELADTTFVTFCLLWHNTSEVITPNATTPPISTLAPTSNTNHAGIIAGCAGGAIVAALLVWLIMRRNKRKSNGTRSLTAPLNGVDDRDEFDFTALRKYKISLDELVIDQVIGTGAYAKVCIGSMQNKPVAIKKLLGDRATNQGIQDFIDEIALTVTFDSPYIIKAFGAAWTSASNLLCVLEYMDMGDLTKYLREHDNKKYTWTEKLKCIHCIVEALVYLGSISVIHRDLKSRNVLLDSTKGAKLADFGIAREEDNESTMTREVGTFRWMAPEVLSGGRYSVAADIYSFGMVLSEFDSHKIPYDGLRDPLDGRRFGDLAIIAQVRDGTLRPVFSSSCPRCIVEIAQQCLAHDPKDRPTSYQLLAKMTMLSLQL